MKVVKEGGLYFKVREDGSRVYVDYSDAMQFIQLRDQFAGAALTGLLDNIGIVSGPSPTDEDVARWCYDYADAMLKAREES